MTAGEKLIAQGEERGRTEGRVEGRVEGRTEVLLRLLKRKFGAVPGDLESRLQSASLEELDAWADRILFADSIQAVFAE